MVLGGTVPVESRSVSSKAYLECDASTHVNIHPAAMFIPLIFKLHRVVKYGFSTIYPLQKRYRSPITWEPSCTRPVTGSEMLGTWDVSLLPLLPLMPLLPLISHNSRHDLAENLCNYQHSLQNMP